MADETISSTPVVFFTKTLYDLSVSTIASSFSLYKQYLTHLPENILFDIYYQLYKNNRLHLLEAELRDLEIFSRMLRVGNRRIHFLQAFQALMDTGNQIDYILAIKYNLYCLEYTTKSHYQLQTTIDLGIRLGSFLSDAGWYRNSKKVLLPCQRVCLFYDEVENGGRTLDCCHELLHAQTASCAFEAAIETYELALETIKKLQDAGYRDYNYAALYAEFSVLCLMRSEYDQAYEWSLKALKELKPTLSPRITVDVLRQAASSCVIKRAFQKAGLLIRQAVYLAREVFGPNHPKYSDVLIDYGYYLLSYDSISSGVSVYRMALSIRKEIFGRTNLLVAMAHEDLAYALYVHEYTSGRFSEAYEHIERAIEIMKRIVPKEHIMFASIKRVKALILEEIASDNGHYNEPEVIKDLYLQSESLLLSALYLTQSTFGEKSIQTAKHYGNLGRLYQSMRRYQKAEQMHLKAIRIKEELLGSNDYEVGLSIGFLASLYNFHMNRYRDAEKLYLRSLAINVKLFGKSYSGLEYDYRGLLYAYEMLHEYDKLSEYQEALILWNRLRKEHAQSEDPPIDRHKRPEPIEHVIQEFFAM